MQNLRKERLEKENTRERIPEYEQLQLVSEYKVDEEKEKGEDGGEKEDDDDNLSLSSVEEQIDDKNKQIVSTPKPIRSQQKESNKQKPRIPLNKPDSLNPLDLCDGIRKMRLRRESANFARQKFAIQILTKIVTCGFEIKYFPFIDHDNQVFQVVIGSFDDVASDFLEKGVNHWL